MTATEERVEHPQAGEAPRRGRPRLPGSIAEVEASPTGHQVGAFFDFDGTLIAGYSASAIAEDRIRRRDITLADVGRTIRSGLQVGMGRADFTDFMKLTANAWKGRSHDDMEELGERLFIQRIADRVYPEARELVAAHQRQGHTVALTSSATRYQVSAIARELGIDHVLCTELVVENGLLTGEVVEPTLWGEGKADAVQKFAAEQGVDLAESYFYADGNEDVALMHLVGKPRPTNPGRRMETVARRRGWPILRFTSRGRTGPVMRIRNMAGMLSVLPIGGLSIAVGIVRRDKREAMNFAAELWFDTVFGLSGVKINVVGREHLWSHRPAVFIFNHRNNLDPLIAASLVRKDFTGVAKKELERDPLMGTLGRLADVAFIDRGDAGKAVEALKPLEEMMKTKGLSIMAAPEGTRVVGERLGSFKKGPFRMAMAAHVPVVPIVIRNAESIGPRNASAMRPGTVDVAVLPPVSVEGWTVADLPERIEGVRRQYLDTLRDWPAG